LSFGSLREGAGSAVRALTEGVSLTFNGFDL